MTEERKDIGTEKCPFMQVAGSYYGRLGWYTCAKKNSPASNENGMCDLEMGKECQFKEEEGE